jgi:non-specific protein-tyrosine kinase
VSLADPYTPAAEAYRSLRTAVHFAASDRKQCVAVTTARSRQGKTETVVNLAVLAAQTGQRVVVVDCDMRSPRVHDFFGVPNDTGFTSVVYGAPLSQTLKRVPGSENLYVLPTGPIPGNPAALLASQRCYEVLASLQADDTLVLIDTPPVLLATDAAQLSPAVGGMLLVASVRTSRRKQLRRALEELRQVDAPMLGSVLYRADSTETGGFGEEASRRERRQARREQAGLDANTPAVPPPSRPDAVEQWPPSTKDSTG